MSLYLRVKMCRIAGGFATDLKDKIKQIAYALRNGGENEAKFYFDQNFALSHNRLAIIDLSHSADQPVQNERFVLCFNGEIYNYKEIAQDLELDDKFKNSDTLVLLAAYSKWGKSCLDKLDGMFAFCIYDKFKKNIFIARDRLGVKPLYYYFKDNKFIFASELKAFFAYDNFDKSIDQTAFSHYLNSGYMPSEQSIFKFIKKLPPAHFLEFSNTKKELKITKYYDLQSKFNTKKSIDLTKFENELESSIISRTVSDVEFNSFLSGGLDSSITATVLAKNGFKFKTISVGFESDKFNESNYATAVANNLGLEHINYTLTPKIAKDIILQLPSVYDEPFGDSSAIPTLFLCQKASSLSKVALSSDGGDEINFGYTRYDLNYQRYKFYKKFSFLKHIFLNLPYPLLKKTFELNSKTLGIDKYYRIKDSFKTNKFMELYALEFKHFKNDEAKLLGILDEPKLSKFELKNSYESMSFSDISTYLSDDIFVKTDRAAMSVSLEVREPLLSYKFVDFMIKIDPNLRKNKALFKSYLLKHLPKELVMRPKMGFALPIEEWFHTDLGYLLDDYLTNQDVFDKQYILNLVQDFRDKKRVNFSKIWHILLFLMWKKRWNV